MKLITKKPRAPKTVEAKVVTSRTVSADGTPVLMVQDKAVSTTEARRAGYEILEASPREIATLRQGGYKLKQAPRISENKLRQMREAKKLSQRQLAEIAGTSQKTVWFWETKGSANPRSYLVEAYAKALGRSPSKVREALKPNKARQRKK